MNPAFGSRGRILPLALVLAFLAGIPAHADAPDIAWSLGPTSPIPLTRFDGEVVNGQRIYFLGGRTTDDATDGTILYLDLATLTYKNTGVTMPIPISNYQIAALQDANGLGLYVFGGRDASANIITDVQVYYPVTNTATILASDPWPGQTPLGCVSLPAMGVATAQNKAIVIGGVSFLANGCADDNSAQTWFFDPMAPAGSRWTQGPNLNVARGYITPAVLGKKLLAIGGDINTAGTLTAQTVVEGLNLANPTAWNDAAVADLPEACDESQAFAFTSGPLANKVVLAGCGQWPANLPDVLIFGGGTWTPSTPLNVGRRNHAGALVGKQMFVLGGYDVDGATPLDSSEHSKAVPAGSPVHASRAATPRPATGVPTN
jgi:hypothetical protein